MLFDFITYHSIYFESNYSNSIPSQGVREIEKNKNTTHMQIHELRPFHFTNVYTYGHHRMDLALEKPIENMWLLPIIQAFDGNKCGNHDMGSTSSKRTEYHDASDHFPFLSTRILSLIYGKSRPNTHKLNREKSVLCRNLLIGKYEKCEFA